MERPGAAGAFLLLLEVCCAQPVALWKGWELMGTALGKHLALCSHQAGAELRRAPRALFSASIPSQATSPTGSCSQVAFPISGMVARAGASDGLGITHMGLGALSTSQDPCDGNRPHSPGSGWRGWCCCPPPP